MAKRQDVKYQRICFTINNYKLKDVKKLFGLKYKYLILGYETAPTTGTPHIQGFVNLTSRVRFNTVKGLFPPGAHFEPARGTDFENEEYCAKGGDYVQDGEPSAQGKRTDLLDVAHDIAEGHTLKRVAEDYPEQFIRYHRGIKEYKRLVKPEEPRNFKTDVYVLVGAPGCGKSKWCADTAAEMGDVYYKPRSEWWDGYEGQHSVIFDDFYGWVKYDEMLKLLDRYPHQVPFKGGYTQFRSKVIFITSNAYVSDWYKFDKYDPTALHRRITHYYTCSIGHTLRGDVFLRDPVKDIKINF